MGDDKYNYASRGVRAESMSYSTKSHHENFTQHAVHHQMNPVSIEIRESRDSASNPDAYPVIIGLDETGSMYSIPLELVRTGLPNMVAKMQELGVANPAILILGIGDHYSDRSPLQVAQFESGDEKLDKWLTSLYLESNGGGNGGESYLLAWYFAAFHTVTDAWEKRQKKGILVTIGDEPTHKQLESRVIKALMGTGDVPDFTAAELLSKARERYEVHHIHMQNALHGSSQDVISGWKELLGDNLHLAKDESHVSGIIAEITLKGYQKKGLATTKTELHPSQPAKETAGEKKNEQEILS